MAELLTFSLLGLFIAFAIGLTGVGAGTLTAPILILLGFDPTKAVGSALTFSAVVKLPAGLLHALYGNLDYSLLKRMLLGGIPGVFTGSYLLSKLSLSQGLKNLLLLIMGFTILFSLSLNLLYLFKRLRIDLTRYSYLLPFACFLIGLEVGLTSAGAGALGMVLLLYFTRLEVSKCVGTDTAFGFACSLLGSGSHIILGHLEEGLFLPMALGGMIGIFLGTRLTRIINPKPLRLAISLLLFFVALNLIRRGLGYG
ncbi:MAG: sulfite exporter TauE/SafE family protein [Aquificaceae bacterium]